MDGQRQQYIPGPPPVMSQPTQLHMINLPPPPPRHPPAQPPYMPPPPADAPLGIGYGTGFKVPYQAQHSNVGWQQGWGRQAMDHGLPPPPPLPPLASLGQAAGQSMAYGHHQATSFMPFKSKADEEQSLTSATYIPTGDTFVPSCGMLPLPDSHSRAASGNYGSVADNGRHVPHNPPHDNMRGDGAHLKLDSGPSLTSSSRGIRSSNYLHDHTYDLTLSGISANSSQNLQQQAVGQASDLSKSPSQRYNDNSMLLGGMSPSEAAIRWPLDRVLLWLAKNAFSTEWQETFKTLEIEGADFLELGHGSNGRGNLGMMHNVIYPQLAKECEKNKWEWDQVRERDEGKRMRKLIRQIHEGNSYDIRATISKRSSQPSLTVPASEGAGAPSASPKLSHGTVYPVSPKGTTTEYGLGLKAPQSTYSNRNSTQMRSTTLSIPGFYDPGFEPGASESTSWPKPGYPKPGLLDTRGDHKMQSPSASSENGLFSVSPSRHFAESPKSGSPAAQNASLAYPGLSGDLGTKRDHSRGNSADSTSGFSRGSGPSRYYEILRQGQDARSSLHDSYARHTGGEYMTPYPREQSKGFLNIFKKRPKPGDSSHPSPEDQPLESPTSPIYARQSGLYPPYARPSHSSSDISLVDHTASSSTPDQERLVLRARPTQKTSKWMFVTADGLNYRLLDGTDLDSVEALRAAICQCVGISDWSSAQICLTEPGQTDHDETLNDTMLTLSRRTKADPIGSLKLFVRGNSHLPPGNPGLDASLSGKTVYSPTTGQHQLHRKPLDEVAHNRASPNAQAISPSPHRQQVVGAHIINPTSWDTSQPLSSASPVDGASSPGQLSDLEKTDLYVRREEQIREAERKQKNYRVSKVLLSQQPRKDVAYGETGYRREGIIDFDTPRVSPYEDKKPETLVPFRKPPSAPHQSNTLTKVNSLSKRRANHPSSPFPVQTHGLGPTLAGAEKMTDEARTPKPSVLVPATDPTGEHKDIDEASNAQEPIDFAACAFQSMEEGNNESAANSRNEQSLTKAVSPDESSKQSIQSRKSYGPEFDFEETKVLFGRPLHCADDSDDLSDDGLFAKPLVKKSNDRNEGAVTCHSEAGESLEAKPVLSVDTNTRLRKGLSVSFRPPSATGSVPLEPDGDDARRSSGVLESPEDERSLLRRNSFARGDVWASRPPVEGVINNLDDFFPYIDLDAPYLEGQEGVSGPAGTEEYAIKSGSERTAAQHGTSHSGGLTRMKSIREVAKGANQPSRNKSVGSTYNQRPGDILRRKSTKMFGAKIMQISPKPGGRLNQLDPIPQQRSPQGGVPQRQPTFRIVRGQLIGKGTYGKVYLGINADNGEVLAVKQVDISPRLAGQDKDRIKEMVGAIDQEIDTMQHLEHPNIVQYLGCERGEYSIAIYLEYISGGSIGSCLRKHGKFEECVVKSLTRQTLAGLAYLHDQGILHRDLKADNILLDLDGSCKISDFGISKKTDNIYGNDSTNSMQGSVFWMAPEVIQSQGQGYSAKVDIWSLGCVVLEMFAGRRPWSRDEAIGAIFKLGSLNQAPPIPDDVSLNITPAALAFMYDCFTVDSSDRPTAETLLTHPFCEPDLAYNFLDTELYAKIRHVLQT